MTRQMKKVLLSSLLGTVMALQVQAQVNPQKGYVITNDNDTIYGTIDYRSEKKCANECSFLPDGGTEYKTYLPGEICGYRFADNGVFYVTKTFAVEGKEKTFFAEFLLQGGVSLFRYEEAGVDYYFFIGEDGKVATVKDDGSYSKPVSDEYTKNNQAAQKRKALREVSQVFAESKKALRDLWQKDVNAKNLTQITHDYDMEYCTSSGDCVMFRYNEKATRAISVKLLIKAGLAFGSNKLSGYINTWGGTSCDGITMNTTVPEIGIGADFSFPRLNRHLSVQVMALMGRWSMSDDTYYSTGKPVSLKYWDLGLQAGPTYSFMPKSKISPILRGGFVADIPLYIQKQRFGNFAFDQDINPAIQCYGFYIGGGVDIAIKKHVLRLTAEYRWSTSLNKEVDISRLGISAEFGL